MPASKVDYAAISKAQFQRHEEEFDAIVVSRPEFADLYGREWLTEEQWKEAVWPTFGSVPFPYVITVDLKDEGPHAARLAGVRTGRLMQANKLASAVVNIPAGDPESVLKVVRAWAEGIGLGSFQIQSYKRGEEQNSDRTIRITWVMEDAALIDAALEQSEVAAIYVEATNYARDLTNVPSNLLTPDALAREAVLLAKSGGLSCAVLNEQEIADEGMGGLSAVGQGSVNPPRMIMLKYAGNPESKQTLGLVGKGITFDTGGISLKKPDGMEEMISDMGGAAVVLAVMQAISRMRLRVNVTAVIAAAENMPSGSAYRPGDVITTLSGRTIEVLNTDAEGRIVLADAMAYAIKQGATKLIDVATLTGAVLVALGDKATAAVTNDDAFLSGLMAAADQTGEKLWQLPSYPEYREQLKSEVADLKNSGGKWAAAITGALFIGEFAEGLPWIHLDTGGTAWLWKESSMDPLGGTGAMTRTLLHYIAGLE